MTKPKTTKPKTTIEPIWNATRAEAAAITPDEVIAQKERDFPPEVINAFNKLIAKHWHGGESVFTLAVARSAVAFALQQAGIPFEVCYLDVEDIYRKKGWKVVYDKPGYNESYEPFFRFTK